MKLYELSDEEIKMLKEIINGFVITANKEQFKIYDKKTDILIEKLNNPIIMNKNNKEE